MKELLGRKIVVHDAEIMNVIDGKETTWSTYSRLGISVACAFDYYDGDYKVFMGENLWQLAELLNDAELVVGFNIKGFDHQLYRGCGLRLLPDDKLSVYDMLEESRKALGWQPGQPYEKYPRGLKLDNHLKGTFGITKTNNGAEAPWMYRTGRLGELITYCLADVRREKALFEYACETGTVKTDTHGVITVRRPPILGPRDGCMEGGSETQVASPE